MPSAQGPIRCDGSRLIGTFSISGSQYYIIVDVKPCNRPFECSNATVTYGDVAQLSGDCKWTGWIGRDDLQMKFDVGVSIVGALATTRSSSDRTRGSGAWSIDKPPLPPHLAGTQESSVGNEITNQSPRVHDAVRNPAQLGREQQLIDLGVPIVAIFGQSGAGKSTFINLITTEKQKIGKGLQSCTSEISVVEANIGEKRIVIIDTPGIDDTRAGVKETDVFTGIADLLEAMGQRKVWVTGVLFLHRISDNRFSQTADRVSTMLKCLCGDAAMSHLMLCTTMWDKVSDEEGDSRLSELRETGAWKEMISKGASTAMISNLDSNAKADAQQIVSQLIKNAQPIEIAIQDEMVNRKLKVAETGAGKLLNDHLQEMQAEAERSLNQVGIKLREKWAGTAGVQEDKQSHGQQAYAEPLRQEREKPKRLTKERRESIHESRCAAAESQEASRAYETEAASLKQQAEETADPIRGTHDSAIGAPVSPLPHNVAFKALANIAGGQQIDSKVPIIAIFGPSRAGKSTFINLIRTGKKKQQKDDIDLQPCTSEISVVEVEVDGVRVVIVDTPGIDDTRVSVKEADVLAIIAKHFGATGDSRVWVTGVLFMHRISETKFSHTAQRISTMLKNLCGDDAMKQLMLCTTMWDSVSEAEGYERMDQLRETGAWQKMISGGASVARISNASPNAKADAERIVSRLIKTAKPVKLGIQDEMGNQKPGVAQTTAGRILVQAQEKQADFDRSVEDQVERMRKEQAQEAIRAQKLEIDRLKDLKRKNQQDMHAFVLGGEERRQWENEQEARKARGKQLRQELKNAERALKELRKPSQKFWHWFF